MTAPGTFEVAGQVLARLFEPLAEALDGPDQARELLVELGLELPMAFFTDPTTVAATTGAVDAVTALPAQLTAVADAIAADDTTALVDAGQALLADVRTVVVAVEAVTTQVGRARDFVAGLDPADLTQLVSELPARLFDHLAVTYLERRHRVVLSGLYLAGLADRTVERPAGSLPHRPTVERHQLHLDRLPALLSDPAGLLDDVYGWGTGSLDIERVLFGLETLLDAVGVFVVNDQSGPAPVLRTMAADIVARTDRNPVELEAAYVFEAGAGLSRSVDLGGGWSLAVVFDASFDTGAVVSVAPPFALSVDPVATPVEGAASVEVVRTNGPGGDPVILLGLAGGPRLEADAVALRAHGELTWDALAGRATAGFEASVAMRGGRIVIALDGADGFLASLLGDGLVVDTDLEAGWRAESGLFLRGSAGLEIEVPVALRLGAVSLSTVYVALGFAGDAITLEASAAIGAELGPFAVAVDRMGLRAALDLGGGPGGGAGNLEVADLSFEFKPPSGLGFVLDAGVVKGGGFLFFEPDRREYGGVLELTLGPVSIKAVGLLTTELPDGDEGWALLLLVFTEFSAIQLGFGVTLNGVGGIIGLQHGISTDALQSGIRTGILDSVLFPADPVANAPQLLGQLRAVFPLTPGALTVGPVLKLGWSTPPLVTLSLGLVLQFDDVLSRGDAQPQLARVVLLGQLKVQVPPDLGAGTPELLKLLIDVVGSYEVRDKALAVDAALRDSHVAGLPLTGSLTIRANFGSQPSMLLAVGGFHPRFTDIPPGVPPQDRVGIQLSYGIVDIRIVGYVAITSNSFQTGAEASLVAAGGGFRVEAYLGFDALFLFQPVFHFEIDFRVGASIKYRSVNLASIAVRGRVSGPGHWVVAGHATISVLFWDVDIDVEVEWGDAPTPVLPTVAVRPQIIAALEASESWQAQLPAGGPSVVTLSEPSTDGIVAHPLGEISVLQRVVPLGITIDRVGTSSPSDGTRFDITTVTIGAGPPVTPRYRDEHFARAEYLDVSEEEKLAAPSFERFRAGLAVSTDRYRVGGSQVAFEPEMETLYLEQPELTVTGFLPAGLAVAFAVTGAASFATVRRHDRLVPDDAVMVTVADPTYVVATADDLTVQPMPDARPAGSTHTLAAQLAAEGDDPALVLEMAEAVSRP